LAESDAYEVEDDDVDSRMIDLDLLGLDLTGWLAWVCPCSAGRAGLLPDPSYQVPFRLRC
jgi:hypothetical protein